MASRFLPALIVLLFLITAVFACDNDDDDNDSVDDDDTTDDDNDNDDSIDDDDNDATPDDDDDSTPDDDTTPADDDTPVETNEIWAAASLDPYYDQIEEETEGFFLHYKNGGWTVVEPPQAVEYLQYISFNSQDHGIAADYTTVLLYDGESWAVDDTFAPPLSFYYIYGVLADENGDWVVGFGQGGAFAYRYENNTWTATDTSELELEEMHKPMMVDGNVYALASDLGENASIVRFDENEKKWVSEYSDGWTVLSDLAFLGTQWGLAAGCASCAPTSSYKLVQKTDSAWQVVDDFPTNTTATDCLTGVDAVADDQAVAVGVMADKFVVHGSQFFTLVDDQWQLVRFIENVYINSIYMENSVSGWAAGYSLVYNVYPIKGVILHWQGDHIEQADLPGVGFFGWCVWEMAIVPDAPQFL